MVGAWASLPLEDPEVDIVIVDRAVGCSKCNEPSSGFMSEALSSITGFYTWKYSSLLVKEYQYIRILFELSTKLLSNR
jgi:hypothetical protein